MSSPPDPRPNGNADALHRQPHLMRDEQVSPTQVPPQYLPGGTKALPGISIRGFCLGIGLGVCSVVSAQLAYFGYEIWRLPFFFATLAVFHYLEFDITARFNPLDASISSYLLTNVGTAYTFAHTCATTETLLRFWLTSRFRLSWVAWPFGIHTPEVFPTLPAKYFTLVGLFLVIVGQSTRSLAMAHATTNFNHIVQSTKKSDHVLVTDGVYALSRHPSYFGFFWWGLGTQLVLGNHFCFLAYTILLWTFFNSRIMGEERHLMAFFGQDYLAYKKKVRVWIPFIR